MQFIPNQTQNAIQTLFFQVFIILEFFLLGKSVCIDKKKKNWRWYKSILAIGSIIIICCITPPEIITQIRFLPR